MDKDRVRTGIIEEAKSFAASEIRPFAAEFDRTGILSGELIAAMAARKYLAASGENISVFIVEKKLEGVKTKRMENLLAARATHVSEVRLEEVSVPRNCLLGREGSGFPYVVGTALDHGRYSVAWGAVGVAQAALEAMVGYARRRSQFGKKIYDFQLVRGLIAGAVTRTHAARALCLRAGEMRTRGDADASLETAMAKYFASEAALETASDAVQVHGGNGCSGDYPVERLFREAKVLAIVEGTSQIQQEIIARFGLRKYFAKDS